MISKTIRMFGEPCILACDAKCRKAWGVNNRPALYRNASGGYEKLADIEEPLDWDDYCYLADDELGIAPVDPGTYEGDVAKPMLATERLNKWCARECERSGVFSLGTPIKLPNFDHRYFNCAPHTRVPAELSDDDRTGGEGC